MKRAVLKADEQRDCSYSLRVSISTCEALAARGVFFRRAGVGSFFSPQTAIKFSLTPLGQAVKAHLEASNG